MLSERSTRGGMRALIICLFALTTAGGVLECAPLAFAQADTLSAAQIGAIQAAVDTALANIDPTLTGDARTQAVAQVLSQVTTSQITLDGPAAIGPVMSAAIAAGIPPAQAAAPILPAAIAMGIAPVTAVNNIVVGSVTAGGSATQTTQAVIAAAIQNGTTGNLVGAGLGQAAASLAISNPTAASQVAQVVSNEGTAGTGQAFGTAAIANGGSQQLVAQALQNPAVTTTAIQTNTTATVNTTNLTTGSSQAITAVSTTVACTTPSCN